MQHASERLIICIDHQQPFSRNGAHQMMELGLDRRQVGKDVCVVVFQIVQHQRSRTVMYKLGALVEECSVVLIGLDDKEARIGKARRNPEILWHTTNQERRVVAAILENPRQHRRGGGLAVGASYCQHPA